MVTIQQKPDTEMKFNLSSKNRTSYVLNYLGYIHIEMLSLGTSMSPEIHATLFVFRRLLNLAVYLTVANAPQRSIRSHLHFNLFCEAF